MSIRSRREAKSAEYHKHVIELLNTSQKAPKPQKGMTQQEVAEIQSQAQMHELRRHTNKHGKVVR